VDEEVRSDAMAEFWNPTGFLGVNAAALLVAA